MGLLHKRVKNARTGRSNANGISTEQMEMAAKGASRRDFLELWAGRTTLQNNVAEQRGCPTGHNMKRQQQQRQELAKDIEGTVREN
jgi:hypothetical protein